MPDASAPGSASFSAAAQRSGPATDRALAGASVLDGNTEPGGRSSTPGGLSGLSSVPENDRGMYLAGGLLAIGAALARRGRAIDAAG